MKLSLNKKVLLRERKRHTACRVVSTHSVVVSWLTPPSAGWPPLLTELTPPLIDLTPPPPPADWPDPPSAADWPEPPLPADWPDPPPPADWPDPPPWAGCPPCEQTNKVKLLPSRRTTYAGGKNQSVFGICIVLMLSSEKVFSETNLSVEYQPLMCHVPILWCDVEVVGTPSWLVPLESLGPILRCNAFPCGR